MLLKLWLFLPLLCYAQDADVRIHDVFDIHVGSCAPHYDKLEVIWEETRGLVKDGLANVGQLIDLPKVDPDSEWYQRQVSLAREGLKQWQTQHPYIAMWAMHHLRTRLAWVLFGTTLDDSLEASKPDLTDPNWNLESTLSSEDLGTLRKVRVNLQLLWSLVSKPKSSGRTLLVCSQDAYKPIRRLHSQGVQGIHSC